MIDSPSTGTHDHSLQASPVFDARNENIGMARLSEMLWTTLLNELASMTPTASLNMSSLKANFLYSPHSFSPTLPISCLSCEWKESSMQQSSVRHIYV